MSMFDSLQSPLAVAGFGVIAVIALQAGACTEGQAAPTGSVTGVTGITAMSGSTSSVVPQRDDDAIDAAAVTSGTSMTGGATMPSGVGSGVGSGAVSGVGSGAVSGVGSGAVSGVGSAGSGR